MKQGDMNNAYDEDDVVLLVAPFFDTKTNSCLPPFLIYSNTSSPDAALLHVAIKLHISFNSYLEFNIIELWLEMEENETEEEFNKIHLKGDKILIDSEFGYCYCNVQLSLHFQSFSSRSGKGFCMARLLIYIYGWTNDD